MYHILERETRLMSELAFLAFYELILVNWVTSWAP